VSSSGRGAGRRFDRDHGVTTQATFFLSQLGSIESEAHAHATHYEPVPVEAFRGMVARVNEAVVRRSTFVDVGSGMGRALLLASEYPFRQVLGIELSPALHAIAKVNLSSAHDLRVRCRDVRARCGDARRARYPKGDLVVFLFNPFDDTVLRFVLNRIVRSRKSDERITLLYHVPVYRSIFSEYAGSILTDTADGVIVELRRSREGRDPSANRRSARFRLPQSP
jgi:SAM-dependent methyltransferase